MPRYIVADKPIRYRSETYLPGDTFPTLHAGFLADGLILVRDDDEEAKPVARKSRKKKGAS